MTGSHKAGAASEVKGIWFVTARAYLEQREGREVVARTAEALLPEHREIFLDALPGEWYPEAALEDMLAVLHGHLAAGDTGRYVHFVEEATIFGTGRFFRVLLALASTRFLLRRVPVLWDRMRRGAGKVDVVQQGSETAICYREFPYFDDANYRLMALGTIRGLCRISGVADPRVEITDYGRDHLTVTVHHET